MTERDKLVFKATNLALACDDAQAPGVEVNVVHLAKLQEELEATCHQLEELGCNHEGNVWRGVCCSCGQDGLESDEETLNKENPR